MMNTIVRLAALFILVLSLASCGSGGSGGGGGNPANPGQPALTGAVAAQGTFVSGQANATYTIAVSNAGNAATSGAVTVSDPPTGFTVTGISGTGWTCALSSLTCTRSDSLAASASFPVITVTGNVTAAGGTQITIPVNISGGGMSSPVTVTPTPTLSVNPPPPAPDFSISVSPSSVSTQAGTTSAAVTVSISALNGFSTSVSVTVSGLPTSVTCSPACPLTINANSSAQLSFVVPANTATGNSSLTIQGTSGGLSHSKPFTLTVTAPPPAPDFSISVSQASVSVQAGTTSSAVTVSVGALNGFTGSVSVTVSGLPSGVSCSPVCPLTINAGSSGQLSFVVPANTATGNSSLTIQGTSGSLNHSQPFTLTVTASPPAPDFSISVSSSSISTKMGTTSSPLTVSVGSLNGFSGTVGVNITGLPSGITCSPSCGFNVNANSSAQVSFVVPGNASIGNSALTVQGTSGSLSHNVPLTLDVLTSLQGFWNLSKIDTLVSGNPAAVSGKIFVSGWGFETIPLTAVIVLVDNTAVGNAFYGTPRPDIKLAGAPEDCGFSLAVDTTTLSNGLHNVSVSVTDSANNVAPMENFPNGPLTTIQINVSNPAPVPTGPVVNLTLNAPTMSLTAGTIVAFTATATNGSGQPVSPTFSWSSTNSAVATVTSTGAVLPLAAGTATISVSAGGVTQQVAVTVQAGSGTPGTIQVSVGPEEVVYLYSRDACMEGEVPDSPAHAVRLPDSSLLLMTGDDPFNFAYVGADFNSIKPRCTPSMISLDSPQANTFTNREWIFSLYREGSTIHALVHNEYHDPITTTCKPGDSTDANPCQYNSVTYAASTDNGQTFTMPATPQNLVAPPPAQWIPPASGSPPPYYGYQEPVNIVHASDGYYYTRFGAFPPPGQTYVARMCVMRTQTLSDPSSWRAWDGSAFELQMTDPYSGPAAALCGDASSEQTVPEESLTFNTYLNMYVLVGFDSDFDSVGNPINCGLHLSLSSDLVHWTAQQLIAPSYVPAPSQCEKPGAGGLAGSFAYASIIDHDDTSVNFETPGRTPYVYYTRFNDNISDRDLVRVPVIITKY